MCGSITTGYELSTGEQRLMTTIMLLLEDAFGMHLSRKLLLDLDVGVLRHGCVVVVCRLEVRLEHGLGALSASSVLGIGCLLGRSDMTAHVLAALSQDLDQLLELCKPGAQTGTACTPWRRR